MSALLYSIGLHWKLNVRNKQILVHFYVVPLIFYVFIGSIFTSIDPAAYKTIIPVMSVFGITMGGVVGSPYPLVEFYSSEIKKAYQTGGIPLWTIALGNFISGLLHLFLMSMIIFFSAPFLFDAPIPENLVAYFIALILLIAASLSVGMIFGLYLKSTSKLGMAVQFIFLPSIMLSGIMFSVSLLPDTLQQIGKLLPATWGFLAMCDTQMHIQNIVPLMVIILISFAASFWKLRKIHIE